MARYVTEGYTSKQIARLLGITDLTVRKHRENLLRKLGLHDAVHIITFGFSNTVWRNDLMDVCMKD